MKWYLVSWWSTFISVMVYFRNLQKLLKNYRKRVRKVVINLKETLIQMKNLNHRSKLGLETIPYSLIIPSWKQTITIVYISLYKMEMATTTILVLIALIRPFLFSSCSPNSSLQKYRTDIDLAQDSEYRLMKLRNSHGDSH